MTPAPAPSLVRRLAVLPLVGPLWLVLGGLLVVPMAGVLALSFCRVDDDTNVVLPAGGDVDVAADHVVAGRTFDAHAAAAAPRTRVVALRSLWQATATTAVTALVGYPLAYHLAVRASARWRGLLLLGVVVPFWTSFVVRTFSLIVLLRPEGLVNHALQWAGVTAGPLELMYNEWAVLVGLVYGELPFMVLPLYASLEKLDRSLLEASTDLGAGGWSTFLRVTLPLSLPGLAAGAVLVFVPSVGQYVVSDLLGGSRSTLLGNLIYRDFAGDSGRSNPPRGAAVAMQMTAGVLLMVWMYARWARKRGVEL
ncbi:MAG TPA: ABC transporter permease [Humisphaera sp.]